MGHQILCASLLGARSQHSDCFPSPGYDAQGPFLPATGCSGCPHLGRGVFWSHAPGHIKGAHAPACVCVCPSLCLDGIHSISGRKGRRATPFPAHLRFLFPGEFGLFCPFSEAITSGLGSELCSSRLLTSSVIIDSFVNSLIPLCCKCLSTNRG